MEIDLTKYDNLRIKDLRKISNVYDLLERMIFETDIPDDIVDYMLKPIEKVLTHNGVNLSETDY